jgi:hypothetical protein
MRYTVAWTKMADGHLANLWIQATNRQAVADAGNRIDVALRDDPDSKARPFGKFFIYEDQPLAVLLEIDPGDRMVRVLSVKMSP